jgi:hypothetical protein
VNRCGRCGSPLLFGYRAPTVDVVALEELLLRVGRLADELPEVAEMDLNPVIVNEHGVVAVGAKVRIEPAAARLPPAFRRMRGRGLSPLRDLRISRFGLRLVLVPGPMVTGTGPGAGW